MSIRIKDLIMDYAVGLMIVAFVYISNQTIDEQYGIASDILRLLCDGSFCAGILLLGAGTIMFCANKGAFNLFGYSFKFGISLILPLGNNPWKGDKDRETYYDYCQRQADKPRKSVAPLLIAGGSYMVLSLIFLLLHYNF